MDGQAADIFNSPIDISSSFCEELFHSNFVQWMEQCFIYFYLQYINFHWEIKTLNEAESEVTESLIIPLMSAVVLVTSDYYFYAIKLNLDPQGFSENLI